MSALISKFESKSATPASPNSTLRARDTQPPASGPRSYTCTASDQPRHSSSPKALPVGAETTDNSTHPQLDPVLDNFGSTHSRPEAIKVGTEVHDTSDSTPQGFVVSIQLSYVYVYNQL